MPPGSPLVSGSSSDEASEPRVSSNEVNAADCASPGERREDKPSHDASIFVGSLPCHLDQVELTRLLTDHLSEYAEVKSVKVVRDSKGGICAFVQCENAEAASNLIHTLHTEKPKPFMGRILRFEPARAFRTLLISYRSPTYAIADPSDGTQQQSLDLPTAMRFWRVKGARFHNIAYNEEAGDANDASPSEDSGTLFKPLTFDLETIEAIARYFGRVEKITPFQLEASLTEGVPSQDLWQHYPPPHHAPRAACMETGCWEVKWDFRDDCVSALMALRRVPHLTVTWAHQPSYSGWECRPTTFPQSVPTTYPFNTLLTSPSSVASGSPLFLGSGSTSFTSFYPGASQQGIDSASRGKPFIKGAVVHSSHGMAEAAPAEHAASWNIWRASSGTDPTFAPAGPYPAPEGCRNVGHSDVPSTPPKTPHTVFPLASRSSSEEDKPCVYVPARPLEDVANQGSIDPLSIFVGGLEAVGPLAWDEEKVRQHFAKYGGLQHVKFVKPLNAMTGFAFLKFDNVEGPAQAVLNEHNRVCGNHVLRVRLRDCNPPRNQWKHARGRARLYHHNGPAYRKFHHSERTEFHPHQHTNIPGTVPGDSRLPVGGDGQRSPSGLSHASPSIDGQTLHDDSPSPSPSASERSHKSASSDEADPREPPQKYREWYDDLEDASAPMTAAPPSISFPPPYPYMMPNAPYYAQPPWVQQYMQPHPPYVPMPYFSPYPMYPPIVHAQAHSLAITMEPGPAQPTTWTTPGVAYSTPFYGFQGPVHPPAEVGKATNVPTEPVDSTTVNNQVNHGHPPSNLSPIKGGMPSEPPVPSPRAHRSIPSVIPTHVQNATAPPHIPQPPMPWNGAPPAQLPPTQFAQLHPSMNPQWAQAPHSYVPENARFPNRDMGRKRQNFRRDNVNGGTRGGHHRGQNNRGAHTGNAFQNHALPPTMGQPPVWI